MTTYVGHIIYRGDSGFGFYSDVQGTLHIEGEHVTFDQCQILNNKFPPSRTTGVHSVGNSIDCPLCSSGGKR
jgi:hypothetical protein